VISGIGVDIVTVSRIAKVYKRFGERFARRFLHEQEMARFTELAQLAVTAENTELAEADASVESANLVRFLAKRFAVKEAAVKALGTGERQGVLLRDFYLEHSELGKPLLCVDGAAKALCDAQNVGCFNVSLSDEGDLVAAFVVLEFNHSTS